MIYDALDILMPRSNFTATGKFWTERPDSADTGGMPFNYEYVDPASRAYRKLYANMQSFEAGEVAIRTNDLLSFSNKGYFMTADGELYRIVDVQKDYSSVPKQALRLFGTPLLTEYVIRGVNIHNPWGAR